MLERGGCSISFPTRNFSKRARYRHGRRRRRRHTIHTCTSAPSSCVTRAFTRPGSWTVAEIVSTGKIVVWTCAVTAIARSRGRSRSFVPCRGAKLSPRRKFTPRYTSIASITTTASTRRGRSTTVYVCVCVCRCLKPQRMERAFLRDVSSCMWDATGYARANFALLSPRERDRATCVGGFAVGEAGIPKTGIVALGTEYRTLKFIVSAARYAKPARRKRVMHVPGNRMCGARAVRCSPARVTCTANRKVNPRRKFAWH